MRAKFVLKLFQSKGIVFSKVLTLNCVRIWETHYYVQSCLCSHGENNITDSIHIYAYTQMASLENFRAMDSVFIYLRGRSLLPSQSPVGTVQVGDPNDQEIFSLLKPLAGLPRKPHWGSPHPRLHPSVGHTVLNATKSVTWKIQA
jgi:hypothetical protein